MGNPDNSCRDAFGCQPWSIPDLIAVGTAFACLSTVARNCAARLMKEVVMKWFYLFIVLGAFASPMIGCEINGDVDDDGAKLEVDVDD
jgi:hypothetical protein